MSAADLRKQQGSHNVNSSEALPISPTDRAPPATYGSLAAGGGRGGPSSPSRGAAASPQSPSAAAAAMSSAALASSTASVSAAARRVSPARAGGGIDFVSVGGDHEDDDGGSRGKGRSRSGGKGGAQQQRQRDGGKSLTSSSHMLQVEGRAGGKGDKWREVGAAVARTTSYGSSDHSPSHSGNTNKKAGGRGGDDDGGEGEGDPNNGKEREETSHGHRTGTIFGLTFNTLTNVMGAGVLSLPLATYNGSILVSMVLLFLCAALSCYAVLALTMACEVTQKFSYTEAFSFALFPDRPLRRGDGTDATSSSGAAAVAVQSPYPSPSPDHQQRLKRNVSRRKWATLLLELVIFLNGFGTVTIYSRIIADSMPPVMDALGWSGAGKNNALAQQWFWLLVPGVIFFWLSCFRTMDELKWTSIVGFFTILYIVVAVAWRYFTSQVLGHSLLPPPGSEGYSPDNEALRSELRWARLSMGGFSTLASYSLAYAYHFNVPYFYNELKERTPHAMMRGAAISFPIITASYGATGLFGYFTFGALVASAAAQGNIVNNFSRDDTLINIGRVGLFFHFATVYPIIAICCRRGLHRIICVIAASLRAGQTANGGDGDGDGDDNGGDNENGSGGDNSGAAALPPGDPRTTQLSSIVLEAFAIVTISTLCAGFASGIGAVVHVVGTLFGTPIVFIFPGLIGVYIFHCDVPVVARVVAEFVGEAPSASAEVEMGERRRTDAISASTLDTDNTDEGEGQQPAAAAVGPKTARRIYHLQQLSRATVCIGAVFLICGTFVVLSR